MSLNNTDIEKLRRLIIDKLSEGDKTAIPVVYDVELSQNSIRSINDEIDKLSTEHLNSVFNDIQKIKSVAENLPVLLEEGIRKKLEDNYTSINNFIDSKNSEIQTQLDNTDKQINHQRELVNNIAKNLQIELENQLEELKNGLVDEVRRHLESIYEGLKDGKVLIKENLIDKTFIDELNSIINMQVQESIRNALSNASYSMGNADINQKLNNTTCQQRSDFPKNQTHNLSFQEIQILAESISKKLSEQPLKSPLVTNNVSPDNVSLLENIYTAIATSESKLVTTVTEGYSEIADGQLKWLKYGMGILSALMFMLLIVGLILLFKMPKSSEQQVKDESKSMVKNDEVYTSTNDLERLSTEDTTVNSTETKSNSEMTLQVAVNNYTAYLSEQGVNKKTAQNFCIQDSKSCFAILQSSKFNEHVKQDKNKDYKTFLSDYNAIVLDQNPNKLICQSSDTKANNKTEGCFTPFDLLLNSFATSYPSQSQVSD